MILTHLRYEVDGHIATITLDRPDVHNAYSEEMFDSIETALDTAEKDKNIRCVVLTGAGRSFSAGGDVKLMRDHAGMFEGDPVQLRSQYLRGITRIPRRFARFDKPVIAAINGHAIGAGLDLACMSDIRIASSRARFGSTFVKIGLVPGDNGAYFLSRVVGFPKALELILKGEVIDAEEALRIGLVVKVVEPKDVLKEAYIVANKIASNAPLAVQLAKSLVYQAWESHMEAALNLAVSYQSIVQNSQDHDEGVASIIERRDASFTGNYNCVPK